MISLFYFLKKKRSLSFIPFFIFMKHYFLLNSCVALTLAFFSRGVVCEMCPFKCRFWLYTGDLGWKASHCQRKVRGENEPCISVHSTHPPLPFHKLMLCESHLNASLFKMQPLYQRKQLCWSQIYMFIEATMKFLRSEESITERELLNPSLLLCSIHSWSQMLSS